MISKEHFIELLGKLRKGTASNEEKKLLSAYYALFEAEPEVLKHMPEEERLTLENNIEAHLFNHITALKQQEKSKLRYLWGGAAAASIRILLTVLTIIFP